MRKKCTIDITRCVEIIPSLIAKRANRNKSIESGNSSTEERKVRHLRNSAFSVAELCAVFWSMLHKGLNLLFLSDFSPREALYVR